VHAFEVLADPVRRRILELLADGERTSGAVTDTIRSEFAISQPAVSQHLKVLRDNGFATVRTEGARRLYVVDPEPLAEVDRWLHKFEPLLAGAAHAGHDAFLEQRLDALETELARGRRARRGASPGTGDRTDGERDRTNEQRETA
jgi:DNA-binding transcriptional ArsR family regulator